MGWPQNFVRISLLNLIRLTYGVSGGTSTGGMTLSQINRIVFPSAGSTETLLTGLYKLPGDMFHLCPSPRSGSPWRYQSRFEAAVPGRRPWRRSRKRGRLSDRDEQREKTKLRIGMVRVVSGPDCLDRKHSEP